MVFCNSALTLKNFFDEAGIKITRKEARKRLGEWKLACELVKVIQYFFSDLLPLLKQLPDPRRPSYIRYPGSVLLMTRILSSLCYISSMRKTRKEFNSETVIQNIWDICGEETTGGELPYWETINRYLEKLEPGALQEIVCQLCRRLLRSRAFEAMRVQGKDWQIPENGEFLKQDCERKACWRLMERLKAAFPRLPICLTADSLYACENWFREC